MDYSTIIDGIYAIAMILIGLIVKTVITKAVTEIKEWVESRFDSNDEAQIENNIINDKKVNFILAEIKSNLLSRFNITNDDEEKETITNTVDTIDQLIGDE